MKTVCMHDKMYSEDVIGTHFPGAVLAVYKYEDWDYEGGGYIIVLDDKGIVSEKCLSHCSCYGPLEEGPDSRKPMAEFVVADRSNLDGTENEVRTRFLTEVVLFAAQLVVDRALDRELNPESAF